MLILFYLIRRVKSLFLDCTISYHCEFRSKWTVYYLYILLSFCLKWKCSTCAIPHANFIQYSPDFAISWQLVLLVGTKLQHVIATLALESAGITGYFQGAKLKPRDELFWFKKPELLLSLIHFVLFQVDTNLFLVFFFSTVNFCAEMYCAFHCRMRLS